MENVLPPKYYHTNFDYLLSFVKDKYKSLIEQHEWHFLRKYYAIDEDAQCLFVRFSNRKGLFFKTKGINYEELSDTDYLVKILKKAGFVSDLSFEEHKLWLIEVLGVLTKAELLSLFSLSHLKNEKREVIVDWIREEIEIEQIFDVISDKQEIIKVNFEREVSFLKFLFFGNKSMDMTEFVLRDLGLVQYYQHADDDLVARFETRKDAEDKWIVSEQYQIFDTLKNVVADAEIMDWYANIKRDFNEISPIAQPAFQRLELKMGKYFEQKKNYSAAIEIYDSAKIVPSRERKARALAKIGYIEEAKATCLEMIDSPQNVDEQYFAEYFLKTIEGKKNKKQTTEWLNTADEITIDAMFRNQVELGGIDYYTELGFSSGFLKTTLGGPYSACFLGYYI